MPAREAPHLFFACQADLGESPVWDRCLRRKNQNRSVYVEGSRNARLVIFA